MNKKLIIGILACAVICIISCILNFSGYRWGLPNSGHLYSYHPDEGINIGGAIRIFAGEKVPGFYNYSSLYFYIAAYAMTVASAFGILNLGQTLTPENLACMYACGRTVSVIFSVLTVCLVFWTGYRLKNLKCAVICGFLSAFVPIVTMHAKFVAVDVTCGFFAALAVFVSTFIKIPQNEEKLNLFAKENRKKILLPFVLACAVSGLAMGTKYNGLSVFLVPFCILLFSLVQKKISIKDFIFSLVLGGICALGVFLITTPGIFLDTQTFMKDFAYEMHHMKIGHGDEFVNTGLGIFYTFGKNMMWGMGPVFATLSAISVLIFLFSKNIYIKSISVFVLLYYISISLGNVRFARYIIPCMSGFCILTGWGIVLLSEKKFYNVISYCVLAVSLIVSLAMCVFFDYAFLCQDSRDRAYEYLSAELKGKSIGLPTVPWFYSPPFIKETSVMRGQRYEFAKECKDFDLKCLPDEKDEWNAEYLKKEMPEYVLISSIERFHKKRLNKKEYTEYMDAVKKYYNEENFISVHFLQNNRFDVFCNEEHYLPSDMTYLQPTFYLYRRK